MREVDPSRPQEEREALRIQALSVLLNSINSGEITSLDGVDSPVSQRIKAHHKSNFFEMNTNWIGSSQNWICPCCSRSKFQISRIGNKGQILAKLVIHHDHMGEAMKGAFNRAFVSEGTNSEQPDGLKLVEKMGVAFAAYAEVLICEDCNNADTEAKRAVDAPTYFSFSPGQIKQFIRCQDHRPHSTDVEIARNKWCESKPSYELRMKIINAVARAAVTDAHWYEPYPLGTNPVPVFGNNRTGDQEIEQWVSKTTLFQRLGPQKKVSAPNLSKWRVQHQKLGNKPPPNFLALAAVPVKIVVA